MQVAPYGSWASPITAQQVATGGVRLDELRSSDNDLYWIELRPQEAGRSVLMRRQPDGVLHEVAPAPWSARTLVHEYGGGAHAAHAGRVFFSSFTDQRVYRCDEGAEPVAITPEPERPRALRYADFELAPSGTRLYCVRETHPAEGEARNELVALSADATCEPQVLWSGSDFVAFPRLSPDGRQLAFTTWDHPRMPWDGTELWLAPVRPDGALGEPQRIAGGPEESIFQPAFGPDGRLVFVSDRTGWWNLFRWRDGVVEPLAPREAEFGLPQWGLGMATHTFLPDGRIACTYSSGGRDRLAVLDGPDRLRELDTPYENFGRVATCGRGADARIAAIAASPGAAPAIVLIDPEDGRHEVLRESRETPVDPACISRPRAIEFPTAGGRSAYALHYPPLNPDFEAPAGETPPLLVMSHGGPTAAASSALEPGVQFWTSRGFAVIDVNYGGSSGFGRAYRERLRGQWGVVDTEDCIHAAQSLVEQGLADGARLAIRGGSAGGYTTLCALVFHDVFAAGASYYGVADAEALARDTHKFESRYLDGLIGPYPEARELYRERSPLHSAEQLSCPLLILQGLEDAIVPPSQAELLIEALEKRGLPYAYLPFAGEQHGFRRAENIIRSLEAELLFYSRVFGFTPADALPPLEIVHAERLAAALGKRPAQRGQ